jgi:hypothetical protein
VEQSPDYIASNGKVLEAMIPNDLVFVNQQLYLVPQFFENKPLARLSSEGFEPRTSTTTGLGVPWMRSMKLA